MCLKNQNENGLVYLPLHLQRKQQFWAKNLELEKADLPLKMIEKESLQSKEEVIELQRLREKQRLQNEQQKRLQVGFKRAQIQAELCKKLQQKAKDGTLEYGHALKENKCIQEEENASKKWKKHFYMDDGLPSTNSIGMRKQLTELLGRGGFHLHK